ncbi:MAG: PAS domain S-box protein [Anaerolineae bacterium]
MNVIDTHTLVINQTLSYALCTGVIALLWYQNRHRFAGLGLWLACFVMHTLGMALIVLRGVAPDWLSVVVANTLLVMGLILLYIGLERFVGQRNRQFHNGVLLLVFILLHTWFTYVRPSLAARNINISAALTVICLQCAWLLLHRVGSEMRTMARWTGFLCAGYCVFGIVRIGVNIFVSPGGGFLYESSVFDALLVLVYQLFFIAVTFSLLLMLNRRLLVDVQTHQTALQEGEARYRQLVDLSPDALAVYRDGIVVFANIAAGTLFGAAVPDELLGKSVFDFVHPDYLNLSRQRMVTTLTTGEVSPPIEEKLFRLDGSIIDVEATTARFNYEGRPALQTLVRDITARKQAEAALRQSEARWQFALEGAGDGVWDWNLQTNEVYFSRQWKTMLGYAPYEIKDELDEWLSRIHPEDAAGCQQDLDAYLSGEVSVYRNEHRLLCKDGTYKWILDQGKVIQWTDDGEPLRMIGTHHDIDERKRSEQALRASEEQYRFITESISDVIWTLDVEMLRFTYVSPSVERLRGFTPEEVMAVPMDASLSSEHATYVHRMLDDQLPIFLADEEASRTQSYIEEVQQPCKDGSLVWTEVLARLVRNPHTGRIEIHGVTRDISERKRAEEIIRLRLQLLEFSADHSLTELMQRALDEIGRLTRSPIGFYHFVEDDQKTLSLQAWSTRTLEEFCKAEGSGMHYDIDQAGVWVDCVHQRRPVIHNDYIALPHRKGMPPGHAQVKRELVVPTMADGRIVAILGVGNKPVDYDEQDVALVAYVSDVIWNITERKRAEETLQQSKTLLEQTVQALEDRERFLATLNDVTYVALGTPDLRTMLQVLADRLGQLFSADGCYITLWDEVTQSVKPAAAYGSLRDTYPRQASIVKRSANPHELTMTESVLLAEHALVAEDVFNTPYLSPRIAAMYQAHSMIGLPLISGSRKLGAALIAYETPHHFTVDEVARAEQTAQQISLAVAKSLLLRESQSLWREAETLREAALTLTSALDHDEVMDRILAQLQQVVPYDTASVQLLREDPDGGKPWLEIVGGRGFTNWEQILGVTFDPEQTDNPNHEVIRNRAPVIVDDGPAVYGGFHQSPHAEAGIRSWLGTPMFVGDRLIGMITLDKTEPGFYTQDHARLAEAFAAQAAVAIENARLYRALQDHAGQLEAQNLELRKLTLAIEQSGSIIEITDAAGLIQYVNPRFEKITGYTTSEMLGQNHSRLHSGEQDDEFYRTLWETISNGQIWRGEFRNKRKDGPPWNGALYWESATIAPVQDDTGQITNYIAVKEDITARKEAEEALRRNAEQLAAQNAELDAFAHTVAHDLKNPLGLVIGYARFLETAYDTLSPDEIHLSLRTMLRSSEKLDSIIRELLLLAGVRKEDVASVPLAMAEIVQEAYTRFELMIEETGAHVSIPAPSAWPVALGHAPWVEEVWANYISNALKYGGRPQEGIPPHVELGYTILAENSELDSTSSIEQPVSSDPQPAISIRFWVRDNGPGLAPEAQAKLFAPFTRLEQVRAQGHGLGLSIVRRIVEKLGGEVGVESIPGQGSCFYFTLPAALNHNS